MNDENLFLGVYLPSFIALSGIVFVSLRIYFRYSGIKGFRIESPCSQYWKELNPGAKKRFCELCQKNVNNICRMSKDERKDLLDKLDSGEQVCVYIEPSVIRTGMYVFSALIFSLLTTVTYREYRRNQSSMGGIMGTVLSESNFRNFDEHGK